MTASAYGTDGLPDIERRVYSALCRPGITTDQQIVEATGLSPRQVTEALQTLLSRYYIHSLPSGGYIVR